MLIYIGTGERRYGEKPVPLHRRRGWEFQAVLQGQISLRLPDRILPPESHRLWIFPPDHQHGWAGLKRQRAQVAVFHFLSVPELVQRIVAPKGYLEISLSRATAARLRVLASHAERYWNRPAPGMMICYEHILMELSLLVCEDNSHRTRQAQENSAQKRVDAALQWFSTRMAENPGLPEIARATGSSPAHLRRLFHEVLDTSPKHILDQMRFQRAMQLMSDAGMKLETISEQCGFGSASAFSRAFKDKFGCSPESWRRVPGPSSSRSKVQ